MYDAHISNMALSNLLKFDVCDWCSADPFTKFAETQGPVRS
jgi:hypothetical protein